MLENTMTARTAEKHFRCVPRSSGSFPRKTVQNMESEISNINTRVDKVDLRESALPPQSYFPFDA